MNYKLVSIVPLNFKNQSLLYNYSVQIVKS